MALEAAAVYPHGIIDFSEHGLGPRLEERYLGVDLRLRWPADVHGVLTPPPLAQLLDLEVRRHFGGTHLRRDVEMMWYAKWETCAVVDVLPKCFLCSGDGIDRDARYDCVMTAGTIEAAAFMCPEHFNTRAFGSLGGGTRWAGFLFQRDELPPSYNNAFQRAVAYWEAWADMSDRRHNGGLPAPSLCCEGIGGERIDGDEHDELPH